jgi:hypothetical protein
VTGFTPPPRREMPPEVRDRLRRRLWRELDVPGKARFDRARMSVAAGIGVIVITACAVIFAQTVPAATQEAMHPTAQHPAVDRLVTADQETAELDRCFQAASSSGHLVADRPQWTVAFTKETAGVSVTAARADGKPLFCESTLTSVTISDPAAQPAYAMGSATGALFATTNGTIAGVVDPAWQRFEMRATNGISFVISEPETSDGLFVMYTSIAASPDLQLHAQQLPADSSVRPDDDDPQFPVRAMPPVADPMASVVDRPAPLPPAPSSLRGQALEQCMHRTSDPVPDIESWQPGASAVLSGNELIMAANARGVATCQWQPYKMPQADGPSNDHLFRPYLPIEREPQFVDARQIMVQTGGSPGFVIAGTVRPDATRMTVTLDGKVELDTDVRAGTFLSVVPDSLVDRSGGIAKQRLADMTTVIYDAKGNTLYNGLLNPR